MAQNNDSAFETNSEGSAFETSPGNSAFDTSPNNSAFDVNPEGSTFESETDRSASTSQSSQSSASGVSVLKSVANISGAFTLEDDSKKVYLLRDEKKLKDQGAMGCVSSAIWMEGRSEKKVLLKHLYKPVNPNQEKLFSNEGFMSKDFGGGGIVKLYGKGETEEFLFMIMEFYEGKTLDKLISQGTFQGKIQNSCKLVRDILDALGELHRSEVVHRDLKPANIIIRQNGKPVILDLGLACQLGLSDVAGLKKIGTPKYAAPEQLKGTFSCSSDIYSLGKIFLEMYTGEIDDAQVDAIPQPYASFVKKCLNVNAENRYANAEEALDALSLMRPASPQTDGLDRLDVVEKLKIEIAKKFGDDGVLDELEEQELRSMARMWNISEQDLNVFIKSASNEVRKFREIYIAGCAQQKVGFSKQAVMNRAEKLYIDPIIVEGWLEEARVALEQKMERSCNVKEESQIKPKPAEKLYTCCRCQGMFGDGSGYSAIQSPIQKPLCNNCFSSMAKCFCCGKYIWKDEAKEVPEIVYEEIENEIVKKEVANQYVCDGCKDEFFEQQESLAKIDNGAVVACDGSGDFEKISDALCQSKYKKIVVKKGIYREHFVVDREVFIKGEEGVVIWDDTTKENAVVVIDAENVVLENLEIRGAEQEFDKEYSYPDRPENIDGCDWWPKCIYIKKDCRLENLKIAYSAGQGIAFCGDGINPIIESCVIEKNSRMGILVSDSALGKIWGTKLCDNHLSGMSICSSKIIVEECEVCGNYCTGILCSLESSPTISNCNVYGNASDGIEIREDSDPIIKNCKIHEGKESGVYVYSYGKGTIEDCDIYGNACAGVTIEDESNPSIKNCKIHDGQQGGVFIHSNGEGTIEGCDIYGNAFAGVEIKEESYPILKNCKIHDGKQGGVFVHSNSKGLIKSCDIYGNASDGVDISEGSNPSIKNCKIYEGKQCGVHLHSKGNGLIENCEIYGNANPGVAITEESNPNIKNCKIYDGKVCGVYVDSNGKGTIGNCEIYGNADSGIIIKEEAEPSIKNCKIRDGKGCGVYVCSKGKGVIEGCDVFGNANSGVLIKEESDPSVKNCKIHDGKHSGVFVYSNGKGTIEDCDIHGNALAGVEIKEESYPILKNCKIHDGKQGGVFVHSNSKGLIKSCDIYGNASDGVDISEGSNPSIKNCKIYEGKQCGVHLHSKGKGTIEDCDIYGNTLSGVEIKDEADPNIKNCKIHEGKSWGVYVHDNGKGFVENCDVYGNGNPGIRIATDATLVIEKCKIHNQKNIGVLVEKSAVLNMNGCEISDCINGVRVVYMGGGNIRRCDFYENEFGVFMVDLPVGCSLTVSKSRICNSRRSGIYVGENCTIEAKNCEIYGNAEYGIDKQKGAKVEMEECEIFDNGKNKVGGFFSNLFG